jgi:hypothetical protein
VSAPNATDARAHIAKVVITEAVRRRPTLGAVR